MPTLETIIRREGHRPVLDDGRGKYPEPVNILAPRGTREMLRQSAAVEKISVGEFVRRAIGEALSVTILPKLDNDAHSDSNQCGRRR
jgi:hypothetical protein